MGIKSQAYIRKLKSYLGAEDLTDLSDEQLEKLNIFIAEHPAPDVLGEFLVETGGKGSTSKLIVESLQKTLKEVKDAGTEDVSRLQEIINQTMSRLESENLTEEDHQQLNALLIEFTQILRDKMLRNDQLRLAIAGGVFLTVLLIAGGFMWYKYKIDCLSIQTAALTGGKALLPRGGVA